MKLPQARWWKRVVTVILLCTLSGCMLRRFEHSQVYHPYREFNVSPAELGRPFEDVRFQTKDGVSLHAWFFPAETNSPRAPIVFLICHGNAGNISHRLELSSALLKTGVAVFVFDYRGYGQSEGRPDEEGTYQDAQAAHAWLRQKGFAAQNIIAYGESLGGAVVTELAVRETLGAIVLQSTFTSIPDLGAELFPWLPVRLLSRIKYDTNAKLPRVNVPVLIMHSPADEIAGYHHAEKNFEAAREPKFFCELTGSHNEACWEQSSFQNSIEKLLTLLSERMPAHPTQDPPR